MTEFALIAPVFMLIVVGMLVFGRLFFYWIETNHLANETARWAVVDRNPYRTAGQTLQRQRARSARRRSSTTTPPSASTIPGKTLRRRSSPAIPCGCSVQVPFSFVKFFGWGVTIKGSSTMRLERIADTVRPDSAVAIPIKTSAAQRGACS